MIAVIHENDPRTALVMAAAASRASAARRQPMNRPDQTEQSPASMESTEAMKPQSQAGSSTKPRGRPRKAAATAVTEKTVSAEPLTADNVQLQSKTGSPPPRRRGRPRKKAVTAVETAEPLSKSNKTGSSPPKRRGRPRKMTATAVEKTAEPSIEELLAQSPNGVSDGDAESSNFVNGDVTATSDDGKGEKKGRKRRTQRSSKTRSEASTIQKRRGRPPKRKKTKETASARDLAAVSSGTKAQQRQNPRDRPAPGEDL